MATSHTLVVISLRPALHQTSGLETVNDRADGRPTDAEVVGEVGLGGGTELGDVAQHGRLGEVEVECRQASVERVQ